MISCLPPTRYARSRRGDRREEIPFSFLLRGQKGKAASRRETQLNKFSIQESMRLYSIFSDRTESFSFAGVSAANEKIMFSQRPLRLKRSGRWNYRICKSNMPGWKCNLFFAPGSNPPSLTGPESPYGPLSRSRRSPGHRG